MASGKKWNEKHVSNSLTLLLLVLVAAGGEPETFPVGKTRVESREGRPAFTVELPAACSKERSPLLVVLHEVGATDEEAAAGLAEFAEAAGVTLLCPRAEGLAFGDRDLPGVLRAVTDVKAAVRATDVHILGFRDAGQFALRFALSHPKEFRAVVAVGTDVPPVRPVRGGSGLWVLLMKGEEDRPGAGRESLRPLREEVAVAEFRRLPGAGQDLDAAAGAYLRYFLDAASGRGTAADDLSFPWQKDPRRGLAIRKSRGSRALVYLYDDTPSWNSRSLRIRSELLFDREVRKAGRGAVPILVPRSKAEEVAPDARLGPGPALVVLDAEGKTGLVMQKKLSAKALAAFLEGG